MERITEEQVDRIVEGLRAALIEKVSSSRGLLAAFDRDVRANGQVRDAKEAIRNISFEQIGDKPAVELPE